ncbi:MBL fold metallo-hydrolase [Saccharothrix variisporea]|uniref:MBL fold metallo-hydrolase n=1 Tax=Saccharothrix variisporea TaxID=543527 RepID=UPI000EB04A34|nr:MBL fold metallo-hydrolase [Saccharothrix variisporea]
MDVLDDYTGHVDPNGPAARRTLGELTITKLSVGAMDNNTYLLVCRATNEALLIDAAADPTRISDLVGHTLERPRLKTVVTTHRHQDHWGALGAVAGANGSNTVAHELDAPVLPIPPDQLVSHGDTVMVGRVPLSVIHLRGHTPGSIALLYRSASEGAHLFTGDSLFPGGVGRTTSPEDFTSLFTDVKERIFDVLPDDTWFYPGHGDDSTLGKERPHLDEWRARGW